MADPIPNLALAVPPYRTCGAMQVHHMLLERNPQFRIRLADLEHASIARMTTGMRSLAFSDPTIPVVVHVVYNSPAQNISNQQISSQIDILNADFGATNPDKNSVPPIWSGMPSSLGVKFKLATRDPQGHPTDGITRTQTARASFLADDSVKSAASGGADAWPSFQYLNIWVCSLGGGLLGYAQFPGGPSATDGVVIVNSAFGSKGIATDPFNLGRTATHEIGHWLNLRHIWGDSEDCSGSDFVADTPLQQLPNYGKPTFPHVSCSNGPSGDMFMNYMDYVDDAAMVMFTPGQISRMRATLEGPRSSILTSGVQLSMGANV